MAVRKRRPKERCERLVKRAFCRGIRDIKLLTERSKLSEPRVRALLKEAELVAGFTGIPLPRNATERLLISGEFDSKQISTKRGKTLSAVRKARAELVKRGIETSLFPNMSGAPMRIVRAVLKYRVYRALSRKANWSDGKCKQHAEASEGFGYGTFNIWEKKHEGLSSRADEVMNGAYIRKAQEQLKDWIKIQEGYFGQKYEPGKKTK